MPETPEAHAPEPPRGGPIRRRILGPLGRLFRRHVIDAIQEEEARSSTRDETVTPRAFLKVVGVLVTASVMLTLLEYFGMRQSFWEFFGDDINAHSDSLPPKERIEFEYFARLLELLYWAAFATSTYLIIPALFITLVLRERLADYGLRAGNILRHLPLYAALFAVVAVAVLFVARDPTFQKQYPFFRYVAETPPAYFWYWELGYFLQFLSLEFFFRGFLIHGLKHRFGIYAIFVSVVPYTMIHFGKPFPETLGAIIAGTVLGFLSLRTGSILLGFLIHISIALTMDLASLYHQEILCHVLDLKPWCMKTP